MGSSTGALRALFAQSDAGRPKAQATGMGPVGSNSEIEPVKVTLIHRDSADNWVYGEEVAADRAARQRVLPRGPGGLEDHFYIRLEYEFSVDKLKREDVVLPATLVFARKPPGYATVFVAPLQSYWAKESMEKLPEAYDTSDGEGYTRKFNPLGFTKENLESRRAVTDLKAISDIASAERDIYLTQSRFHRASIVGALVSEAFHDANPGLIANRWVRGNSKTLNTESEEQVDKSGKGPQDGQRLGLVLTDFRTIEAVAAEIIVGLNDFRTSWEKTIERGSFRRANRSIKAAETLVNLLDAAIELGVWQALAGIDEDRGSFQGQHVTTLARQYAEYHLSAWNKTLRKVSAFLGEPIAAGENGEASILATQDQFEYEELLAILERSETDRDYYLECIRILEVEDLGLSPDRIASGIRMLRKQIRGLDNAAD